MLKMILSRVGWVTWLITGRMIFNTLFYFAFPRPSDNHSPYNFTTHKLKTLSSDIGILYCPSWQPNLRFYLLNSGLCRTPRELTWTELSVASIFYNLEATWILNTIFNRRRGSVLTELLNSNRLSRLYLLPRMCHGTFVWQWLFRVYSLERIWVLSKRWLAMDVCSASDIQAFRQHATIYIPLSNNSI
jgi:hypothetical protein